MTEKRSDEQQYERKAKAQPAAVGRRPWIRVDRCTITKSDRKDQPYAVRIEGHNLYGAIVQPIIEVGGLPLQNISFDRGGKVIEGTLPEKPQNRNVVVDYDVAHATVEATYE